MTQTVNTDATPEVILKKTATLITELYATIRTVDAFEAEEEDVSAAARAAGVNAKIAERHASLIADSVGTVAGYLRRACDEAEKCRAKIRKLADITDEAKKGRH